MGRQTWMGGVLALAALTACGGSSAAMKPAPTAQKVEGKKNAAQAAAAGVTVMAKADTWSGEGDVRDKVTPVNIVLINDSDQPLAIRYEHFALTSGNGQRFAALPPFQLREMAIAPIAVRSGSPIKPEWKGEQFEVAGAYVPLYRDAPAAKETLDYDAAYYNQYYSEWQQGDLPNNDVMKRALPEGILRPGGRVEGYLYFENVPEKTKQVQLRTTLVNAETEQVMDRVSIPFVSKE